jgi:hypothetical protein
MSFEKIELQDNAILKNSIKYQDTRIKKGDRKQ